MKKCEYCGKPLDECTCDYYEVNGESYYIDEFTKALLGEDDE